MPVVICQPGLWCWWSVAQRGVRSDGVVVGAPAFGQYPQFLDRVEDLRVEELISEFRVERFAVAVLPWRAGFDVQCLCAGVGEPLHPLSDESTCDASRSRLIADGPPIGP
jgi:hypothetical protein